MDLACGQAIGLTLAWQGSRWFQPKIPSVYLVLSRRMPHILPQQLQLPPILFKHKPFHSLSSRNRWIGGNSLLEASRPADSVASSPEPARESGIWEMGDGRRETRNAKREN